MKVNFTNRYKSQLLSSLRGFEETIAQWKKETPQEFSNSTRLALILEKFNNNASFEDWYEILEDDKDNPGSGIWYFNDFKIELFKSFKKAREVYWNKETYIDDFIKHSVPVIRKKHEKILSDLSEKGDKNLINSRYHDKDFLKDNEKLFNWLIKAEAREKTKASLIDYQNLDSDPTRPLEETDNSNYYGIDISNGLNKIDLYRAIRDSKIINTPYTSDQSAGFKTFIVSQDQSLWGDGKFLSAKRCKKMIDLVIKKYNQV